MKVMRKSVLASSLVMLPGLAQALGLGAIEVKSALNQPLNAEIAVIQAGPGEAAGLAVDLAKAEDFARVGIDRTRLGVPLEFAIGENARGEPVIRVTSSEPIREPFLTFLLDVNWDRGRLLREYTVLLDPPVMAPARRGTAVASAPATRPAPVAKPEPLPAKPAAEPAPAVAAAPATSPAPTPAPTPSAAPAPTPAPAAAAAPPPAPAAAPARSEYGPVGSGETLWEVATATRPAGVEDMNRLMLTLLRMNPDAFYEENINALKRGAVLRIPTAAEVNAIAVSEARDAVAQQNEIWRGYQERAAGRSTALADAGGSRPGSSTSSTSSSGRLEIVPPRAGADQGGADRPGSGAMDNSSAALRDARADLARSQEDLATARQEATELRSRVSDLEKIKTDQERLLKLRDDELAALKARIEDLERASAAAAAAPAPAPAPAVDDAVVADDTSDDTSVSAQDIWGSADTATPSDDAAVDDTVPDDAMAADDTTAPSDDLAPADTAMPDEPAPAVTQPVPEPVAVTPQPVEPAPAPASASKPWYQNWYLLGGGVAALLALVGLAASRRRKPAAVVGGYDDTDDSAVDFGIPGPAAAAPAADDGDFLYELQGRLSRDPADLDAHLQLLRHLYAQGDADGFEQAAEAMLPQVDDQHGPEWSEARSLGEALLPGNPLFAEPQRFEFDSSAMEAEATQAATPTSSDEDMGELSFDAFEEPAQTMEAPAFEAPQPVEAAPVASEASESLDFDFDFDSPTQVIEPVKAEAEQLDQAAAEALDQAAEAADATTQEVERAGEQAAAAFEAALEPAPPKTDDLELPALDFDFSDDVVVKKPEVMGFSESQTASVELDLDAGVSEAAAAIESAAPAAVEAEAEDDGFIDLDFGSLGESDAVGTKLDLARAYIDMGDPDGARSMLEEVIAEGNAGQRSEAEKLIGTLG